MKVGKSVNSKGMGWKAVVVIVVLCWGLFFMFAMKSDPFSAVSSSLRGATSNVATKNRAVPSAAVEPAHLIIVAGHAALKLSMLPKATYTDDAWYLLSYQRNQGFPQIISSHIKKGIELLQGDSAALLIFSGGETRKEVGPISEAASYYYVAQANNWLSDVLAPRVFLEEFARDSLENLMFSICRFREVIGRYPSHISVVGFDFKKQRFNTEHRLALRLPEGNFSYVGVASPAQFDQSRAEAGEHLALQQFEQDLYGCQDKALASKRQLRNPFKRTIPYELACPEMSALLHWCGPGVIAAEDLPWR